MKAVCCNRSQGHSKEMASEKPESGHTNLCLTSIHSSGERPLSLLIFLFLSILFTFKSGKEPQKKEQNAGKITPEGKRLLFATLPNNRRDKCQKTQKYCVQC